MVLRGPVFIVLLVQDNKNIPVINALKKGRSVNKEFIVPQFWCFPEGKTYFFGRCSRIMM